MIKIPLISINNSEIPQSAYLDAIRDVIASGNYILGPQVKLFESEIAEQLGVKHAIGVANGTDALVIALDALGIGHGDEVITTAYTFFATAESILRVGAKPVFVDVREDTYNLDPSLIEAAITDKTKAIMPVHIFGNSVDFNGLKAIADRHKLFIIEDACQAIGATYQGQMIGALGDVACFSFFPTKNLGGFGDGGLMTTNRTEIAERIQMLRFHGQKVKYKNELLGYNSRLDEIQAAVLNIKRPHLKTWNNRRRTVAQMYNHAFESLAKVIIPTETHESEHVYHLYCIMAEKRDELAKYLESFGIGTGVYYAIPLHLQLALTSLGYKVGDLPVSEMLSQKALALPMFPDITNEEVNAVINAVKGFYRGI